MKDSWDKVSQLLLWELQVPRGRWNEKMRWSLFHIAFLAEGAAGAGRKGEISAACRTLPWKPFRKFFQKPLAKYDRIVYNTFRRTARVLTAKWTSWLNENFLLTRSKRYDTISNVAEMPRLTSARSEKIRLDKRQNCDIIISLLSKCGSSSVVEHNLAKVGVAGSSPVFRSTFWNNRNSVLNTEFLRTERWRNW